MICPTLLRARAHIGLTVFAAAAAATLQFALIDRGGFWMDDFVNLAEARRLGLGVALFVEPVYQHFAPGHRILDWLVAIPFGESYTAAVLVLALCIAGAVVAFTLLLDECFGRRRAHIVLAAAAGSSWTITDTGGWFAASAHSLPSIFLTQLALLFFVRTYRRRRRADYLLTLLVFVLALMFWELSLLFLVEAALLIVLLLGRHDTSSTAARSLLQASAPLIPFALIGLAYVLYVNAQPWHQPFDAPTGTQLVDFTRTFVLRGWLLPLVGGGAGVGPLGSFERLMQVLAGVAVFGGLVVAVLTRRAIVRGLVFLGATFLIVWFAVAAFRLHAGSAQVGDTGRLITPLPFLFWFAVAFMLQPAAGRRSHSPPRMRLLDRAPSDRMSLAAATLVLVLAVPYALNLKHTDDVLWFERLEGVAATAKANEIARGVRVARERGLLSSFVESPVPDQVAFPGRWDDTLWRMGAYFDSGIHAIGEGRLLLTIDGAGVVRENTFSPARLASGEAPVSCHAHVRCTAILVPAHALPAQAAYVRVTLTASGPTRLQPSSVPPATPDDGVEHRRYYDDTTRHLEFGAGRHTIVLPLWAVGVTSVSVVAAGSALSLQAELGVLAPLAPLS